MTDVTIPTLGALMAQLAIGLAVFQANRHRLANQCFLLLSLVIAGWLGSLYLVFIARTPEAAEFAIRQASVAGVLYLSALNLLRLSVRQKGQRWSDILSRSRIWLFLTIGFIILCQTNAF